VLRHKRRLKPAYTPLQLGNPILDGITLREPDMTIYDPPILTRNPDDTNRSQMSAEEDVDTIARPDEQAEACSAEGSDEDG
jgi:hypothetical protein